MSCPVPQVRVPDGYDKQVFLRLARQHLGQLRPRDYWRGVPVFNEVQCAFAEAKAKQLMDANRE